MTPLRPDWWRAYVGRPWLWRGMDMAGFDCWGLCVHALREAFAIDVDDFGRLYPDDAGDLAARASSAAEGSQGWRQLAAWEEGAVCLFGFKGQPPIHAGMALRQPGRMLHASAVGGVNILDVTTSDRWRRRLAGLYLPD